VPAIVDSFPTRRSSDLYVDGQAISDLHGDDRAWPTGVTCLDCRVEASVLGFGVNDAAVFARMSASGDRYQLNRVENDNVQIQRRSEEHTSELQSREKLI